jgi:hypothetical protein
VLRLQASEDAREQARGGHRQRADRHGPASRRREQIQLLVEPRDLGQDRAGGPDQLPAGIGDAHAARMPVEEPKLHDVLEFLERFGQSRLADAERRGRLQDAARRLDRGYNS